MAVTLVVATVAPVTRRSAGRDMPQIDYTKVSSQPLAAVAYHGPRFYDGTPGHETVTCPQCRRQSDPLFLHDDDTPGCRSIAARNKRRS